MSSTVASESKPQAVGYTAAHTICAEIARAKQEDQQLSVWVCEPNTPTGVHVIVTPQSDAVATYSAYLEASECLKQDAPTVGPCLERDVTGREFWFGYVKSKMRGALLILE